MIKTLIYISIVLFFIDFLLALIFFFELRSRVKKEQTLKISPLLKILSIIMIGLTVIMLFVLPIFAITAYL